jgi:hypothetical protein
MATLIKARRVHARTDCPLLSCEAAWQAGRLLSVQILNTWKMLGQQHDVLITSPPLKDSALWVENKLDKNCSIFTNGINYPSTGCLIITHPKGTGLGFKYGQLISNNDCESQC